MAIGVGNLVSAADYNAIHNTIKKVLGDDGADPQVGYGRSLVSSAVSSGELIDSSLIDNLYNDLVKARTHQKGTNFTWSNAADGINAPDTGEYIGAFAADIGATSSVDATADQDEGFLDFSQAAADILADKDLVGSDQTSTSQLASATRATAWNTSIVHEVELVFINADERRYYFNSQGLLSFNASLTGGNSVAGDQTQTYPDTPAYQKDEIWQTMLNNMGAITFGKTNTTASGTGTGSTVGNYDLTSSYQTIFTKSGSGVYSENFYRIEAKGAQSSNKITFKITFSDSDTGDNRDAAAGFPGEGTPVDEDVTGTINSTITSRAATGALAISHPGAVELQNLGGGALSTSYILTPSSSSVSEGSSVSVTLTTTGLSNGTTVPYTISDGGGGLTFGGSGGGGFTDADLSSGSITGSFTIQNNTATLTFGLADEGVAEGTEIMTLSLDNGKASTNINVVDAGVTTPTYSITNPSPNVIAEGATGTFTVNTSNVPAGTDLYWTISHLTTSDADFAAVQGGPVALDANGNGTIDVITTADATTEGQESFILRLRENSYTGTIVASGGSGTTVGDTSTTQAPSVSLGAFQPGDTYIYGFDTDTNKGAGSIISFQPNGDVHADSRNLNDNDGLYNVNVINTTAWSNWLPAGRSATEYEIKVDVGTPTGDGSQFLGVSNTYTSFYQLDGGATIAFVILRNAGFANVNVSITITIREKANTNISSSATYNAFFAVEQ